MKKILHFALAFFVFLLLGQCKTKKVSLSHEAVATLPMTDNYQVIFADSIQGSMAITTDDKDHFFDRVTFTEMSIQMKQKRNCASRDVCVAEYKDFLKRDVESFSEKEVSIVSEVFEQVAELVKAVNPALIDRDIILIKTKGNHYGDGVFYTRENKIVIPQNVLIDFNKERFTETMLHEFFHIFSRYNKETRDQLYSLIGFKPVEGTLEYGDIGSRKLLNPDGTTDYYIELEDDKAYPLITASEDEFVGGAKPTFFNYLEFHLYKLDPGEDGILYIRDRIPFDEAPSFFTQIKDNTNYIIHPDEIMADNFIYSIYNAAQGKKIKTFSPEGLELIEEITSILKDHQ